MPITRSAKKALRASLRKAEHNERRRRAMKEAVKVVRKIATEKKGGDARAELSRAYKAIDKAAKRGVIKKGAASRKKSRLAKALKKAAGK